MREVLTVPTNTWTTLPSSEDLSVNFLRGTEHAKHEARYVRRSDDYFICYLSSHDGCKMGCRFCHLTQMRENSDVPVTLEGYLEQSQHVFDHYDKVVKGGEQVPAKRVHFNFMARGDALLNPTILENFVELKNKLEVFATERGLEARFKISSILPQATCFNDLSKISGENVALYYSLYSFDDRFRRRWLPNAMDGYEALDRLARWQIETKGRVVLHWALIAGENDDLTQAKRIVTAVNSRRLKTKFNLVRYNTPGPNQGIESSDLVRKNYFQIMSEGLSDPSRTIERVGMDVAASCGMFM